MEQNRESDSEFNKNASANASAKGSVSSSVRDSSRASMLSENPHTCKAIAAMLVNDTLSVAKQLINSDRQGVFFYPKPVRKEEIVASDSNNIVAEFWNDDIDWCSIEYFTLSDVINQIRDFISRWHLTPSTKFVLITRDSHEVIPLYGRRYYVDAMFSKPTPRCPNPLAVATAHFTIYVPILLPDDYPVMVTYKFEGYKTVYYTAGKKTLPSLEFQRYFIDSILQMKLSFYSEIFQCRHAMKTVDTRFRRDDDDYDDKRHTMENRSTFFSDWN